MLAFLVIFAIVLVLDVREQAGSTAPSGVTSYSNLSRNHTEAPVNYPQTPPVGGDHNPVWQNCGFYSKRSGTRTPSTPWSTGRCGSLTDPTCPRAR